ncbi:MAG: DUF4349 domain-containing protein [Oscillospiraceae bacterium]|jgi:hypothetical protein|nr:DUF4349 domain-containing protein [Oscillospiraceae bacterium]
MKISLGTNLRVKRAAAAVFAVLLTVVLCLSAFGCASASLGASSQSAPQVNMALDSVYSAAEGEIAFGEGSSDYLYTADAKNGYAPAPAAAPGGGGGSGGGLTASPVAGSAAGAFAEKIIYSANASIESVEFDKTLEALEQMIIQYDAFIESSSVSGADYATTYYGHNPYRGAFYSIRVPREHFNAMTGSLSSLGNVTRISTNADNVTEQYMDVESRLTTYRIEETRLLAMLEKADNVTDMITIESTLSGVRYEIEALTSRLKNLDNRVSYSSVTIDISEVEILTEPEQIHLTYTQQIAEGLKATLRSVGNFFKDALRVFIVNLPVLIICAVIIVVVILIAKGAAKKGNKRLREGSATDATDSGNEGSDGGDAG